MSTNSIDSGHLKAFIERIERLEEEKRALAEDIKDVYAEAKGVGYDVKIMRKIVSLRRQDSHKRKEEEEILDLYLSALGMG
ncbi:MAG TPA: DUF2312 domain-containing protein [Beijerinckiaceae bacterium]|nr:DUF2312 domain-containing protein [Rhodoblastus sp.]MCC0002796.1 DUF2312 domain-containing protein [Methylobacteriaceae bacterium]HRY04984.1 DUF2312 domain-containing protein [Beijerinckiaceae bacterium]MCB1535244.1 DUF2312 domain-containing protein [Rhodoblastus sp.]MCB1541475.1 DUF2312 domain-containing protein [Rhodoblastus sp.]